MTFRVTFIEKMKFQGLVKLSVCLFLPWLIIGMGVSQPPGPSSFFMNKNKGGLGHRPKRGMGAAAPNLTHPETHDEPLPFAPIDTAMKR
jgi:hypothetical protein